MAILAFQKPDKVIMLESMTSSDNSSFVPWNRDTVLQLVMHFVVFCYRRWKAMQLQLLKLKVLTMSFLRLKELLKM
jgi:hypothetical protein